MSIRTFNDLKVPWFHARGTRVYDVKNEWKNTQFVTVLEPSEYQAGDNFLMQCAANFRTDAQWRDYFHKAGGFGVTARGEISFGDAFAKLLKSHRMKIDSAKGAPSGITFAGYNNAVGSIKSGGNGAIILGTYIVGRLALSLSKEWVSVQVGYYDIPCLGTGNEVVSCRVRETDFSIRRPHRKDVGVVESDEDIIIKFLKFGLSLSDLSFPNICELIVSCGQPVNGSLSLDKINGALSEALKKKNPYANPNIMYSFRNGNSIARTSFLLRSLPDDFTARLRECKYQPSYFGKTGNAYWGDYLVNRSMQTPFQYGKTVEETVMNCIDYCRQNHWGNYVAGKPVEEPVAAPVQPVVAPTPQPVPQPVPTPEPQPKVEGNPLKDVDFSAMDWEDDEETAAESGEFVESAEEVLEMFDEPAYNEKEAKKDFARMWKERMTELKALKDSKDREEKAAEARGEGYEARRAASEPRRATIQAKQEELTEAILAHPVWQNYRPEITKDGRYKWGADAVRMANPREFAEVLSYLPGEVCFWGVDDLGVDWGYSLKTPEELMGMSEEAFERKKKQIFEHDREQMREYLQKYFGIHTEAPRVDPDSVMHEMSRRSRERQAAYQRKMKEDMNRRIAEIFERQKEKERAEREARERAERERLEAEAKSNEYFEDFADDLRRRLTEAIENNQRAVFEVDENDEDNWYNPYAYMGYVLVLGLQMVFGLKDVYERGRVTSVDYYYGEEFFQESAHKVQEMYDDVNHVIAQSFLDLDTKHLTAEGKKQVGAWRDEYDEFAYGLEKAIENHFDRLVNGDREGDFKYTYYRLVNDVVDSVKSNLGYFDDLDLRA